MDSGIKVSMWEVCWGVSTLGLSTSGRVKKQDAVRELSFLQRPGQVPGGALELALTTQTCPAPSKGACSLFSFTEQSLAAAFPPAPRPVRSVTVVGSALAVAIPKGEPGRDRPGNRRALRTRAK